jgi:hypothetical protein
VEAELEFGSHVRDLIPGDPDDVERLTGRLRTFAGGMSGAAERLTSIQAGEWRGPAGDAFRALLGKQPERFHVAGSAFSEAASAVARYAEILRQAQADAGRAIVLFEQGHRQTQAWRQEHDRYDAEARAAALNGTTPVTPRPPETDPGAGDRARAQQLLDDARALVQAQARTTASLLRAAQEAAPERPGLLDALTGGTGKAFASLGGTLTGAWDATTAFLDDAAGWVSDTWEAIDGPDLTRIVAGTAGVIAGVVAVEQGVAMAAAGVVALIPGTAVAATGVGTLPGAAIDLGALGLVAEGVGLVAGGGFIAVKSSDLLSEGISGLKVHMSKKPDIRQINDVARRHGIRDRKKFGNWIEKEKKADPGTKNERGDYTYEELEEKAEEYKAEGNEGNE